MNNAASRILRALALLCLSQFSLAQDDSYALTNPFFPISQKFPGHTSAVRRTVGTGTQLRPADYVAIVERTDGVERQHHRRRRPTREKRTGQQNQARTR